MVQPKTFFRNKYAPVIMVFISSAARPDS